MFRGMDVIIGFETMNVYGLCNYYLLEKRALGVQFDFFLSSKCLG